ncbi:unnamed protein product [Cuscuta campestris]|uniref:Uncharacterized protein n=1 Tax=Cuscuta campestris TaxID=132261 RepID=A0A484K8F2_9ASTE|nr:unnamed protein product [Cuscuta campestris]
MANPSNRSPSPLPTRPRTSTEPNSAARRSFGGTPSPIPLPLSNTGRRSFRRSCPPSPSNSPADSGRRSLPVKEEKPESWDCSEKENERAAKLRSPAKGSKNFMSPTFSAASKFSSSPKKKVLVERNEPVRTSISLCDGKATFFSSISSDPTENSIPKPEVRPGTKSLRKVTFSEAPLQYDDENDVTESDSLSNEKCLRLPFLDMSPCMNHASPRPKFTLYSPKPSLEVLKSTEKGFDMVGESKRLDESFGSAIVSEDLDSESQSDDSHTESDDSSSTTEEEMAVEEEPKSLEEEEEIGLKPEAEKLAKESHEGEKKSRIFICLKWAFTVFLLMVAACVSISVTDSPVFNGYGVEDANLADLSSYWGSQVQSTLNDHHHFGRFFIPPTFPTDELSPMFFTNSTCLVGGTEWEFKVDRVFEKLEEEQDHELDDEAESEDLVKDDEVEEEADSDIEEELEDEDDVPDIKLGGKLEVENLADEEDVGSAEEEEISAIGLVVAKDDGIIELNSPPINGVESEEVHTDFADSMEISVLEAVENDVLIINDVLQPEEEEEVPTHFDDNRKILALEEAVGEGEPDVGIDDDDHLENIADEKDGSFSGEESPASQMHQEEEGRNGFNKSLGISASPLLLLISSAVAVAAAAAVLISVKQSNRMTIVEDEKQETVGNAVTGSGTSSEEVSTSGNSTSRRRGRRRMAGEAEEEEKRKASSRRESVATSDCSLGSLSYGSFTTYEKIPLKHHHLGNGGGDEGMTPVRRSSRIRSQTVAENAVIMRMIERNSVSNPMMDLRGRASRKSFSAYRDVKIERKASIEVDAVKRDPALAMAKTVKAVFFEKIGWPLSLLFPPEQ